MTYSNLATAIAGSKPMVANAPMPPITIAITTSRMTCR